MAFGALKSKAMISADAMSIRSRRVIQQGSVDLALAVRAYRLAAHRAINTNSTEFPIRFCRTF
jgi:hypothetical protein